jgi:hypothetical protein
MVSFTSFPFNISGRLLIWGPSSVIKTLNGTPKALAIFEASSMRGTRFPVS